MARNLYGCTSADFTLTESGRVVAGATATVWSARTGGTQITDLTDLDGDAITLVTSDADGGIRFYGVDGDKDTYWLDTGTGARIAVRPADLTGEIGPTPDLTIGTVTTGTAAATITGTDAAPVLNLTLPTAGANGVDTAAIADGAVTAAKIADGTITSTDVAAGTFASFATVGNLLTANQASIETDTAGWDSDGATSVARSTAQAYHGSASLLITSPANGYGVRSPVGVSGIPVVAGETYTVTAACKSASRTQQVSIIWYTAAGSYIQENFTATAAAPTSWTLLSLSMVAPATAAYVAVSMRPAESGSEGDTAYWDSVGFWKGAGGVWQMPGVPIPGGSRIAVNNAVDLSGTGTPEGVVVAAPGSTWLQTDSTTDVKGWIKWVKATGTGNTGWVAGAEADTGRRNVVADIDADWAANASVGYIRLQRVGERVYFEARLDRVTASGGRGSYDAVYTVPSGFAPRNAYNIRGLAFLGPAGVAGFVGDGVALGVMEVWFPSGGTWAAGDDVYFTAEWYTNDSWPSSLPGSAI